MMRPFLWIAHSSDSRAFASIRRWFESRGSRIVTFVPRREAVAAGLATLALNFGVARAQQPAASGGSKEQAARLAAEAESLGKKQQFADALNKYKEAARLDPATAAYQCNIGMAYYALGDEARAHLYFGRCYKQNGGWPANVEDVFNYVVGVLGKEEFTPLKISGTPPGAEIVVSVYADEGPLVAPVTVYVPFSNYEIQVRHDGYKPRSIPIEANARDEKVVSYDLEQADPADNPDPGTGTAGGNLVGSGGDVDQQVDTGGGRKKWPLLLAGGGVAAAVGGFFVWRSAKDKQDQLFKLTDDQGHVLPEKVDEASKLEDQMRTREAIYWSLFGVGAAAIAGGLVLYFMQPDHEGSGSVSVSAAPVAGGGMVSFSLSR